MLLDLLPPSPPLDACTIEHSKTPLSHLCDKFPLLLVYTNTFKGLYRNPPVLYFELVRAHLTPNDKTLPGALRKVGRLYVYAVTGNAPDLSSVRISLHPSYSKEDYWKFVSSYIFFKHLPLSDCISVKVPLSLKTPAQLLCTIFTFAHQIQLLFSTQYVLWSEPHHWGDQQRTHC